MLIIAQRTKDEALSISYRAGAHGRNGIIFDNIGGNEDFVRNFGHLCYNDDNVLQIITNWARIHTIRELEMKRQLVTLFILFLTGIVVVAMALLVTTHNIANESFSASGFPICLNEVMSSNSAYYDEHGNAYDWIELYNSSTRAVSLANYKLTDNERKIRYVFPVNTVIPAGGYFLVWCERNASDDRYADFSISKAGGETIVLMNSRSVIVDRLVTKPLERNTSLARDADGVWQITDHATPGFVNSDAGYAEYLAAHRQSNCPVRINELMSANQSYLDEKHMSSDWIELLNTSSENVVLSGMRLTDRVDAEGYLFPEGTVLPGNAYLIVRCGSVASDTYAPFSLASAGGETITLSCGDVTLDTITLPALLTDMSYALDGTGNWVVTNSPTPGFSNTVEGRDLYLASVTIMHPNIRITELMADNISCLQDADGDFSDWIELTNYGTDAVALGGFFLSDRQGKPLKWALPNIKLPVGGRIVIFASGKDRLDENELHAGFSLNRYQGVLTLCAANGQIVSSVTYPELGENISYAFDESTGEWRKTKQATPGFSNNNEGYLAFEELRSVDSPLVLNEAMPGNASLLRQSGTTYFDWIELRNRSCEAIDLDSYYLTDNLNKSAFCALPTKTLAPGEFIVLLCTGDTPLVRSEYDQIALSLDAAQEQLYLINASGAIVDVLTLSDIPYGCSAGRLSDQNGQFYFSDPTPGTKNKMGYRMVSTQPVASVAPGVYDGVVTLTVSLSADGDIYYTTDGSTPTERSQRYTEPIEIGETTVIRTAAVSNGKMISRTLTLNYFLNEAHTLPILAVSTDEANLYDDSIGILAGANLYNRNIIQPANVSFFSVDGTFNADCGLKLHGAGSRGTSVKKSFKIVFQQKYGLEQLDFPLFPGSRTVDFDSFLIRIGQDYTRAIVRDELLSKIAIAGTTELMVQDTRFCVFYLNGEYMGIYCIKEAYSSGYFVRMFGVSKESVEMQRGYLTQDSEFQALIDYAMRHDLSSDENYRYIEERVNLESMIDWCIYEAYSANHDLAVNIRYYRSPEYDNNRWHYALLDMDYGFDGPASFEYVLTSNHGILFKRLLNNLSFRDLLLKRLAYQLENWLTEENVMSSYDTLTSQIASEVPRERARWIFNDTFGWERHLQTLMKYLSYDRIGQMKQSIADAMNIPISEVEFYFGKANG